MFGLGILNHILSSNLVTHYETAIEFVAKANTVFASIVTFILSVVFREGFRMKLEISSTSSSSSSSSSRSSSSSSSNSSSRGLCCCCKEVLG